MKSQHPNEDMVPLLDDDLPSYDSATLPSHQTSASDVGGAQRGYLAQHSLASGSGIGDSSGGGYAGGSGSTSGTGRNATESGGKAIPGYYLNPPAKAERLAGEYPTLEGMEFKSGQRGSGLWISDARLNDRMSLLYSPEPEQNELWAHGPEFRCGQGSGSAVLYDFLRLQAAHPPQVRVKCFGSHKEERSRNPTNSGGVQDRDLKDTVTVVDFDFYIDLEPVLNQNGHYTTHLVPVPPNIPTFRGTPHYSYGGYGPTAGRGCSAAEKKVFKREWKLQSAMGVPIWDMHPQGEGDSRSPDHQHARGGHYPSTILASGSATDVDPEARAGQVSFGSGGPGLMEWCEAYCAARGAMKELVLRKQLWGWDLIALERALKQAIASTGYNTENATVSIDITVDELHVCPANWYSRAKQSGFGWFMLCLIGCVTLVLPVIWILRDLGVGEGNRWIGGGSWKVAYATYALKSYPPLPGTYANESVQQARERLPGMFKLYPHVPASAAKGLVQGPKGVHYLAGRKEGEWFREWEERVRMGVQMRHKGELRGTVVGQQRMPELDGYDE